MRKTHPCSITAKEDKADLVRRAAASLGIAVEEESVLPKEPGAILFSFGNLSDADTVALAHAVPLDAYYFSAVLSK